MTADPKHRVVFVSTGEGSRAAMAAAWLAHLGGDTFEVECAGTEPTPAVDPHVRHVMDEVGIALGNVSLPSASELRLADVDLAVVLRPRDAEDIPETAALPEVLYWSFGPLEDSSQIDAEERVQAARRMRDELRVRVGFLINARIHP